MSESATPVLATLSKLADCRIVLFFLLSLFLCAELLAFFLHSLRSLSIVSFINHISLSAQFVATEAGLRFRNCNISTLVVTGPAVLIKEQRCYHHATSSFSVYARKPLLQVLCEDLQIYRARTSRLHTRRSPGRQVSYQASYVFTKPQQYSRQHRLPRSLQATHAPFNQEAQAIVQPFQQHLQTAFPKARQGL